MRGRALERPLASAVSLDGLQHAEQVRGPDPALPHRRGVQKTRLRLEADRRGVVE